MNTNNSIIERLKQFMDDEARSCSMDFGCVTPVYVFRMWGGAVAIEDIATAMENLTKGTELLCLQLEKLPMSAGHAQKKVSFW